MDGDTTEGERLRGQPALSKLLTLGQRVSRNLADELKGKAERHQTMAVV